MHPPIKISRDLARRFQRRALLLDAPREDIAAVLDHHGCIQIDPINVCGRMHDLILRHRVAGYCEGDLMRHVHGASGNCLTGEQRLAFEHHLPSSGILVAFPLEAWPHLRTAMRRRTYGAGSWSGRLSPRQKELSVHLLKEITARGPLSSEDFKDGRRARAVWGSATLAKSTLQKLFFHGRLLIARRGEGNRRFYDLPERALPAAIFHLPEPGKKETARWEVLLKLRQRRLVFLKRDELPLVADMVRQLEVENCPPLFCLRSDLPLLDELETTVDASETPLLLAPLDPLIYDRRLTSALWDFDYTWEAYTPPGKRKRGYYALPVLAGIELVGHVDPKADRKTGRLRVAARSIRHGFRSAPAVKVLADFLRLR
jgi:uncharacterized protein